ncbi:MAG: hypothetical protein J6T01_03845 [Kiritimatiellae bacterium]|nr:hypothetical protein [Kiritimatiellia bacterium]
MKLKLTAAAAVFTAAFCANAGYGTPYPAYGNPAAVAPGTMSKAAALDGTTLQCPVTCDRDWQVTWKWKLRNGLFVSAANSEGGCVRLGRARLRVGRVRRVIQPLYDRRQPRLRRQNARKGQTRRVRCSC